MKPSERFSEALIVYTTLGENALGVRVLHFFHLSDQVGEFDQLGMSVAAGADDVNASRTAAQGVNDHIGFQHFVADDVIYLVEDDQIVFFGVDGVAASLPALFSELDVLRIGFRAANFDEAAAHRANFKFVVAQHFGGVEFAIVPGSFDELNHEHAETLTDGAKCGAEGAGGFALAGAGVDDQESFFLGHLASTGLPQLRKAKYTKRLPEKSAGYAGVGS